MKRSEMIEIIIEEIEYYTGDQLKSVVDLQLLSEMILNRIQGEGMTPPVIGKAVWEDE